MVRFIRKNYYILIYLFIIKLIIYFFDNNSMQKYTAGMFGVLGSIAGCAQCLGF